VESAQQYNSKGNLTNMKNRGWIKTAQELTIFANQNDEILNKGAYLNLMAQLNKAALHAKGISVHKSLPQYYKHLDLFCRFLADNFNLKNLANFQDKHLVEYVIERQYELKSAATIKNDLAAIRYFHNQIPHTRYTLSSNQTLSERYSEFNLERRRFGGVDRRPTNKEYYDLVELAKNTQNPSMAYIIILAREVGLRVHEAVRLNRSDAKKAIELKLLTVKGKGGLIRDIPLNEVAINALATSIKNIPRGEKLFVPLDQKAHQVIQRVQDFIKNNRYKIIDPMNTRPIGVEITMHSFRHAYAKQHYDNFIAIGYSEEDARLKVSRLIGHNREDVTNIYLAQS